MRGSLRQRSAGTWELRYDGPRDARGGRRFVSETVRTTKKEAERILRERVSSIETGTHVGRSNETVGQFIDQWLESYAARKSPRTYQAYRQHFKRDISPSFGHVKLQDLRAGQIEAMYASILGRGTGVTTVRRIHMLLHKVLGDAVRRGLMLRNPVDMLDPPPERRAEMQVWTPEETNAFFSAAESSRFHDLYELAIDTGMRRSELVGVRRVAVDLDAATLLVAEQLQRVARRGLVATEPKRRSRRLLELSSETVEMLRGVRRRQLEAQLAAGPKWRETGYVFTNAAGQPLDSNRLTADFREIVRRAGLRHLTLHGLRHTNATLMIRDGVDVLVLSRRLGHASVRTTLDLYGHLMPGMQDQAVGAVRRQLRGGA